MLIRRTCGLRKRVTLLGTRLCERAMAVRPPAPVVRPSKVGTFWWHVRPRELPVQGIVYPDGSELDARVPEMSRTGWAFVITSEDGVVLAAAYGVPPPWITDIGGAESWALFQSTSCTIPALCKYWPDCLPVKQAVAKGVKAATNPRNPLARVHTMLVEAFGELKPTSRRMISLICLRRRGWSTTGCRRLLSTIGRGKRARPKEGHGGLGK